jgi:hypothetical protein
MRAVTTCVGYDDYLQRVLPSWLPIFEEIIVVTASMDARTQALVHESDEKVCLLATDVFFADNAVINKGAGLNEALKWMEPFGWIAILDADVVIPRAAKDYEYQPGFLYSPLRRSLDNHAAIPPEEEWGRLGFADRESKTGEFAGYCQIFHAGDPSLRGELAYPAQFPNCQGCDTAFYKQWPRANLRRPPWEVLHIGPTRKNWLGRRTARIDGESQPEETRQADRRDVERPGSGEASRRGP